MLVSFAGRGGYRGWGRGRSTPTKSNGGEGVGGVYNLPNFDKIVEIYLETKNITLFCPLPTAEEKVGHSN